MSKINQLIQNLCPAGVEYKKLEDVLTIKNGRDYKQFGDGDVPVYGSGGIMTYINTAVYDKPSVLIPRKGSLDKLYYVDTPFWNVDTIFYTDIDTSLVEPKYIYYYLEGQHLERLNKAGGVPSLTQAVLNKVQLPVPPLEVQCEIVHILDKFTELTAELTAKLTAELTARKKQYEYYHNSLMDFSGRDIEYKSVGELFEIKNGLNKGKDAFGKGQPIINFTDVYNKRWLANGSFQGLVDVTEEEIKRYSAKKGDVFFTRTSETKEDIGMSSTLIEDIPNCVFSGFVLRARPFTDLLLPKFCSYYFSTNKVRDTIVRYAAFTTRATTTGPKLSKIMVPILSLEEQERIVSILDRFDALCNDITSGLPAEIEARQKQYEYYRDKLLSFQVKSYG